MVLRGCGVVSCGLTDEVKLVEALPQILLSQITVSGELQKRKKTKTLNSPDPMMCTCDIT
jgi:hypothetical protein